MKKTLALLLALTLLFALTAVSAFAEDKAEDEKEPVELIVFAAASMTETLTEIKDMYEEANPHVTIIYNFDSSGTLKTQIQEGADCDVFISAGQKQMNQLDISADPKVNTDELDWTISVWVNDMGTIIRRTRSVCPVCLQNLPAQLVREADGRILLEKTCPEHGAYRVPVWQGVSAQHVIVIKRVNYP